jgi:2,3-bisphosphoglycerate-independent phosphoglycerate mutase
VLACEAVDIELGKIVKKALEEGYNIVVTADHGNAEKMLNENGSPCTAHTTNQVPLILVCKDGYHMKTISQSKLGNIAPTILDLMNVPKPKEMTEASLLRKGY